MRHLYAQLAKRWVQAVVGPRPFIGLFGLPRYLRDWHRYGRMAERVPAIVDSHPCLSDWQRHTPFDAHYFYQGAWLARRLSESRPPAHVDIGSDIRMINVLSAFVPTEFVDFRPLDVELVDLKCSAGNLTALGRDDKSIDSLSCLHVIEHIGLGRYGDPIDPDGSDKALAELQRVLANGGRLYLSVPVGRQRVCFNAHRVFSTRTVSAGLPELELVEFSLVDDQGSFHEHADLAEADRQEYGCGLFVFERR